MKRNNLFLLAVLSLMAIFSFTLTPKKVSAENLVFPSTAPVTLSVTNVYDSLQLEVLGLSKQVFDLALQGHNDLVASGKLKKTNVLSIVDFSLPSTAKRLFVVDLENYKLLFNTYVSHGRNSGLQNASSFSNEPESFKSSLGFYSTAATYSGKHGYSLQLEGLEKGFNDNAMSRGIVMHAANYVDETIAKAQGYIGRSLGCPAVPEKLHTAIIAAIANGSCLFMYANDNNYLNHSSFLHASKS
ncbi:MAG: murein L,D-transpeptidase catalytic domain family protein [Chitinophagaceae bacterium]|nr:murein L,D-transpeptidase catalytic domain family protein [Chitinophagaceae bacterium]